MPDVTKIIVEMIMLKAAAVHKPSKYLSLAILESFCTVTERVIEEEMAVERAVRLYIAEQNQLTERTDGIQWMPSGYQNILNELVILFTMLLPGHKMKPALNRLKRLI